MLLDSKNIYFYLRTNGRKNVPEKLISKNAFINIFFALQLIYFPRHFVKFERISFLTSKVVKTL